MNLFKHMNMFDTYGRWRNDITQFMSGAKELGLYCCGASIDCSIEQVLGPAGPS